MLCEIQKFTLIEYQSGVSALFNKRTFYFSDRFWASGLPHDYGNFTAVTCCDQQGKWTQRRNDYPKKWICEKEIL